MITIQPSREINETALNDEYFNKSNEGASGSKGQDEQSGSLNGITYGK